MNTPVGSSVRIKSTFLEAGNNLPTFHREVLDYWQRLRGDRAAPALSEFDLAALDPETVRFMNITDAGGQENIDQDRVNTSFIMFFQFTYTV